MLFSWPFFPSLPVRSWLGSYLPMIEIIIACFRLQLSLFILFCLSLCLVFTKHQSKILCLTIAMNLKSIFKCLEYKLFFDQNVILCQSHCAEFFFRIINIHICVLQFKSVISNASVCFVCSANHYRNGLQNETIMRHLPILYNYLSKGNWRSIDIPGDMESLIFP